MSFANDLDKLDHLQEIFEKLSSGQHLDATYDSELWAALQGERKDDYATLFKKLGMTLKIHPHNFAYFEFDDKNQKSSRRLLLLFILLFKFKSDEGANLLKFTDQELDESFFENLKNKNTDILDGESLKEGEWSKIIRNAVKLGFIRKNGGNYYLLPATWRFLDLFLELAAKDENEIVALNEKEDEVDDDQDDEEDA